MVLGTNAEIEAICKKLGYKRMNLRKGLFNMMRKGKLEELFSLTHNARNSSAATKAKAKAEAASAEDEELEEDEDE